MPAPNPPTAPLSANAAAPRQRRRRLILILAGAVALLILFILLLVPTLLGTAAGTAIVISQINSRIAGKVKIDSLSLGWFSGQHIHGFTLLDPHGQTVLTAQEVDVPDLSILSAACGSRHLGTIKILKPTGALIQNADGSINLLGALQSVANPGTPRPAHAASQKQASLLPPNLSVQLQVLDGHFTLTAPGTDPVTLDAVAVTLDIPNLQKIQTTFSAKLPQPPGTAPGVSSIASDTTLTDLFDPAGNLQIVKASIDSTAKLQQLPVAFISRLARRGEQLSAILGPTLDVTVENKGPIIAPATHITVSAANFTANLNTRVQGDRLVAQPDSGIHLHITPETWAQLVAVKPAPGKPAPDQSVLEKPFEIVVALSRFSAPQIGSTVSPQQAVAQSALTLNVSVGDIAITAPAPIGEVALTGASVSITSEALAKGIDATLQADAAQNNQSGKAALAAHIRNALTPNGQPDLQHLAANIDGSVNSLPLAALDEVMRSGGLLVAALGPTLNTSVKVDLQPGSDGHSMTGSFALTAKANNLDADISGDLAADRVTLKPASHATLKLTSQAAEHILHRPASAAATAAPAPAPAPGTAAAKGAPATPLLAQTATINVVFDQLVLPLHENIPDLSAATLGLTATVDQIVPGGLLHGTTAALRKLRLNIPAATLNDSLHATVHANLESNNGSGTLDATLAVASPLLAQRTITANADVSGLPSALLDGLAQQGGKLIGVLGDRIGAIKLSLTTDHGGTMHWGAAVDADRFHAKIAGDYLRGSTGGADGGLTVRPDSTADLTIVTDTIRAWEVNAGPAHIAGLVASRPGQLHVALKQLDVPVDPDTYAVSPKSLHADLGLTITDLVVTQPGSDQPIPVTLSASVKTTDVEKLIAVNAVGNIGGSTNPAASGAAAPNNLSAAIQLAGLKFHGKKPDLSAMTASAKVALTRVPVVVLGTLINKKRDLTIGLGDWVTLTVGAQLAAKESGPVDLTLDYNNTYRDIVAAAAMQSGPVDLTIDSPNITTSFKGSLDKGLVLHLREDAVATLRITPAMSDAYLATLNPMLTGVESTGGPPVTLTLKKEGFAVPLHNLQLSALTLDGRLELGTLRVHRADSSIINGLIVAMKVFQAPVPSEQTFDASFTPATFHIAQGTVKTNDLWLYSGGLLLGTQARVYQNPGDATPQADIVLGVPSEMFGFVHKALAKSGTVYELTASGPVNHIDPDFGAFFTKSMLPAIGERLANNRAADFFKGAADAIGKAIDKSRHKDGSDNDDNDSNDKAKPAPGQPAPGAPGAPGAVVAEGEGGWVDHTWPNKPKVTMPTAQQAQKDQGGDDAKNDSGSVIDQGLDAIGGLFGKKKKKPASDPPPDSDQ